MAYEHALTQLGTVVIKNLQPGDILQYGSDGVWHNVPCPKELAQHPTSLPPASVVGLLPVRDEVISSCTMSGCKQLSGIRFYTTGKIGYSVNVLSKLIDAIVSFEPKVAVGPLLESLPASGVINKEIVLQPWACCGERLVIKTFISSQNECMASPGAFVGGMLYDGMSNLNTGQEENFTSESFRTASDSKFDDLGILPNWISENGIEDSAPVGYRDGLQVAGGTLIYPSINYQNFANGPVGNRNYGTQCTGERTFYRIFQTSKGSAHNFKATFDGVGIEFLPVRQKFTKGDQVKVEIKAPSITGWLDIYDDFAVGKYGDGSGCRRSKDGLGRSLNTSWGITLGNKGTGLSNNMIVLKITVPQHFSGRLTKIGFDF